MTQKNCSLAHPQHSNASGRPTPTYLPHASTHHIIIMVPDSLVPSRVLPRPASIAAASFLLLCCTASVQSQSAKFCVGEIGQTNWACETLSPVPAQVGYRLRISLLFSFIFCLRAALLFVLVLMLCFSMETCLCSLLYFVYISQHEAAACVRSLCAHLPSYCVRWDCLFARVCMGAGGVGGSNVRRGLSPVDTAVFCL